MSKSEIKELLYTILFILFMLALVGVPTWYKVDQLQQQKVVVSSENLGVPVNVSYIEGNFVSRGQSRIETTEGTFLVIGIFQAPKRHNLVLENRKDGSRFICDKALGDCFLLVKG